MMVLKEACCLAEEVLHDVQTLTTLHEVGYVCMRSTPFLEIILTTVKPLYIILDTLQTRHFVPFREVSCYTIL